MKPIAELCDGQGGGCGSCAMLGAGSLGVDHGYVQSSESDLIHSNLVNSEYSFQYIGLRLNLALNSFLPLSQPDPHSARG
ncbi:unnamed protein product [Periconia digitata]|uniref:Uncharacterized protein n=1 Tax=Periconia digitata TaxID=1303443 RepID=A0A9W4UUX2_9PLEO|nr:unnamed protein product [Periconia digitata]